MKDPKVEEQKKPQKSKALFRQHFNSSEISEQAQKEQKKKDKQYWSQKP